MHEGVHKVLHEVLHEVLHKGLHEGLHKGVHKSVHKACAVCTRARCHAGVLHASGQFCGTLGLFGGTEACPGVRTLSGVCSGACTRVGAFTCKLEVVRLGLRLPGLV